MASLVWGLVTPARRRIFGDDDVTSPRDEQDDGNDEPDKFEDTKEELSQLCDCGDCAKRVNQSEPQGENLATEGGNDMRKEENEQDTEDSEDTEDTEDTEDDDDTEDNANALSGNQKQLDGERERDPGGSSKELSVKQEELKDEGTALAGTCKGKEPPVKPEGRVLDEKEREMNEKSKVQHIKQQELDKKNDELDKKDGALKKREYDLVSKEEGLEETERLLEGKQQDLDAREIELDGRQTDLEAKESEVEGKQKDLNAKEVELQTKERQLEEKERQLRALGGTLAIARDELESLRNAVWSLERKGAEKEEELKRRLNALGLEWVLVA